ALEQVAAEHLVGGPPAVGRHEQVPVDDPQLGVDREHAGVESIEGGDSGVHGYRPARNASTAPSSTRIESSGQNVRRRQRNARCATGKLTSATSADFQGRHAVSSSASIEACCPRIDGGEKLSSSENCAARPPTHAPTSTLLISSSSSSLVTSGYFTRSASA